MENILLLVAVSIAGGGIGAAIPLIVKNAVAFKCKKNGKSVMQNRYSVKTRALIMLLTTALSAVSIRFIPLRQALFYIVFGIVAIIGTLIDNQIRIIPNELVLLLFAIGLAYRIMIAGPGGLIDSFKAFLFVAILFSLAAGITFFLKKGIGVGAGDLKLSVIIAFIVGLSGMYFFLFGMAAAILVYCFAGLFLRKLTLRSTFPMCGVIMAGFVISLFAPYVMPTLSDYLPMVS